MHRSLSFRIVVVVLGVLFLGWLFMGPFTSASTVRKPAEQQLPKSIAPCMAPHRHTGAYPCSVPMPNMYCRGSVEDLDVEYSDINQQLDRTIARLEHEVRIVRDVIDYPASSENWINLDEGTLCLESAPIKRVTFEADRNRLTREYDLYFPDGKPVVQRMVHATACCCATRASMVGAR